MKIIPTIFAHSKKEFEERFRKLLSISKDFQIDFMDGKFVPGKSVKLKYIPFLQKNKNFEAHLMVKYPDKYLVQLKQKGFKKIIFHIESVEEAKTIISKIKSLHLIPFIAINPNTPLKNVLPYLPSVGGIMFMGVYPGKEHQRFISSVYKKISRLRSIDKKITIQVDGGINEKIIKKLANLKVDVANSGSYISDSDNPKQALAKLRSPITL